MIKGIDLKLNYKAINTKYILINLYQFQALINNLLFVPLTLTHYYACVMVFSDLLDYLFTS